MGEGVGLNFSGGGEGVEVKDENNSIGTFKAINFTGADVSALAGSGQANIYIPAVSYASHYNTTDGDTGNQSVSESISRTTTRISTASAGQFLTNGWENTNQAASLNTSASFTTPGVVTGFGGDATATVTAFSADGTTVLETYTTPALTGNATHTSSSGFITVTITSYGADDNRFQANMAVAVNIGSILTGAGYSGGRYNVFISMSPDTTTDGTGPYTYTQTSVFLDSNPTTPSVGAVTIGETGGSVVTKFLSGVEYYTTGSDFTLGATNINQLNRNTARTTANIQISAPNYGINSLNQSPFGTGSGNFSGWTSQNTQDAVSYSNTAYAINNSNFRYMGTAGRGRSLARDPWASSSNTQSSSASILVDTYGTTSTNTFEGFTDEARRQESDYTTAWTSTADLTSGEAMVYNGQLIVPNQAVLTSGGVNTVWTSFSPNPSGQPSYGALGAPASYYRTFTGPAGDLASFAIVFTGTFISNATTDLANDNLQILVRRVGSASGGSGTGSNPLRLNGAAYNFATFNDGATVSGSYIRESSSSGNTVNGTFGGFAATGGIYVEVIVANAGIKISSMEITFF